MFDEYIVEYVCKISDNETSEIQSIKYIKTNFVYI
jgi:hypothetical protein